jgi:phosphoglycerate dehydrogenase-like enzyme
MALPKTLIVTVPGMIGEEDIKPLRAVSDVTYDERESMSEAELAASCEGYEYLMLNYDVVPTVGPVKLSDDFYRNQHVKALKAIATDITGMDWASPNSAVQNGALLLNIPHYSTRSVAESILSEVLLHSRQRHRAYMDQMRGETPQDRKGINVLDRTAGIIGWGSIGERTAELLGAIGMNVIAWNRSPREGVEQVSLETLFERSNVICVCLKTVKEG